MQDDAGDAEAGDGLKLSTEVGQGSPTRSSKRGGGRRKLGLEVGLELQGVGRGGLGGGDKGGGSGGLAREAVPPGTASLWPEN